MRHGMVWCVCVSEVVVCVCVCGSGHSVPATAARDRDGQVPQRVPCRGAGVMVHVAWFVYVSVCE